MFYPLLTAFSAGFLLGLLIMAVLNVRARRRICSECLASAWTHKPDYQASRPPSVVKDRPQ